VTLGNNLGNKYVHTHNKLMTTHLRKVQFSVSGSKCPLNGGPLDEGLGNAVVQLAEGLRLGYVGHVIQAILEAKLLQVSEKSAADFDWTLLVSIGGGGPEFLGHGL
jgi:hypothetical protein